MKDFEVKRGLRRLANNGSGSSPTLPQFVKACREIGDHEGAAPAGHIALPALEYDGYHLIAQRWLFAFLLKQGGVDEVTLKRLVAAKNRIVQQFRENGGIEEDGNVAEWLDVAMTDFAREAA